MEESDAQFVAEAWPGGGGLVPRGPRMLLGFGPADREDVLRHTGVRPGPRDEVWRVQVGGRFLRASAPVYPGGVPVPEALQARTAVVSSEVWLYVEAESLDLVGMYSWPEAVRRPVASSPRADLRPDSVRHVADIRVDFDLRVPAHRGWEAEMASVISPGELIVLLVREMLPDPLNEMVLFEQEGLTMRASAAAEPPDLRELIRQHQPPYRPARVRRAEAAGRDPGRALGPQTWPWPGELRWWDAGVNYELRGFQPLSVLVEVAGTLEPA